MQVGFFILHIHLIGFFTMSHSSSADALLPGCQTETVTSLMGLYSYPLARDSNLQNDRTIWKSCNPVGAVTIYSVTILLMYLGWQVRIHNAVWFIRRPEWTWKKDVSVSLLD